VAVRTRRARLQQHRPPQGWPPLRCDAHRQRSFPQSSSASRLTARGGRILALDPVAQTVDVPLKRCSAAVPLEMRNHASAKVNECFMREVAFCIVGSPRAYFKICHPKTIRQHDLPSAGAQTLPCSPGAISLILCCHICL
jgi:hypothetical protein